MSSNMLLDEAEFYTPLFYVNLTNCPISFIWQHFFFKNVL